MTQESEQPPILVAYDEWDASNNALQFALERAVQTGEPVHIATVDTDSLDKETIKEQVRDDFEAVGVSPSEVEHTLEFLALENTGRLKKDEDIGGRIVGLLHERDFLQIVIGNPENQGKVQQMLSGSVTEQVIEANALPMTLVPGSR